MSIYHKYVILQKRKRKIVIQCSFVARMRMRSDDAAASRKRLGACAGAAASREGLVNKPDTILSSTSLFFTLPTATYV